MKTVLIVVAVLFAAAVCDSLRRSWKRVKEEKARILPAVRALCEPLVHEMGIELSRETIEQAASHAITRCMAMQIPVLNASPISVWMEILLEREFLKNLIILQLPGDPLTPDFTNEVTLFAEQIVPFTKLPLADAPQWSWLRPACWRIGEAREKFPARDPRALLIAVLAIIRGQEQGLSKAGLTIVGACRALEAYELQSGRLDPGVRVSRQRLP